MHGPLTSRRQWLTQIATAALVRLTGSAQPSRSRLGGVASGDYPVRQINAILNAGLLSVSPDGTKVCLYVSRDPVRRFRWNGHWDELNAAVREGENSLQVLATDSWHSIYSARLPSLPSTASFFADSQRLYTEVPAAVGTSTYRAVSELVTDKRDQMLAPLGSDGLTYEYHALQDNDLIGAGRSTRNRVEVLVKAELPYFRETKRVPFIESGPDRNGARETPIAFTPKPGNFTYGADNSLVVRRSHNLELVWHRQLDLARDVWLRRVAIAADGGLVAVSASDNVGLSGNHHVAVYSGEDGKEVIRINADSMEGLAISPNHELLAVGHRLSLNGRPAGTQPTVLLFEIASGKLLATLIHDQFYGGGKEFLYAGVDVAFTSDGRYLITSGLNTRVWKI